MRDGGFSLADKLFVWGPKEKKVSACSRSEAKATQNPDILVPVTFLSYEPIPVMMELAWPSYVCLPGMIYLGMKNARCFCEVKKLHNLKVENFFIWWLF